MRHAVLAAALVWIGGCSGGSSSGSSEVRWEIRADFTLNEGQDGSHVTTRSGLYFRVEISSDDPDRFYWELSFYDGFYVDVVDHWTEGYAEGLRTVWIFKTRDIGECWLEFSEYPRTSSRSTRQVTYFFDIL